MNQPSRSETSVRHPRTGRHGDSVASSATWTNPGNRAGSLRPTPTGRGPGEKCDGQRPKSEKVPAVPRLESEKGRHQGPRNLSGSPLLGRGSGARQGGRQAGKPSREPDYERSSRSGRKADFSRHRRPVRDWGSTRSLPRSLYPPNGSTSKPARSVPTSEGLLFARNVSSKLRRYCQQHSAGVKGEFVGREIAKLSSLQ
jgi:hypothetical protein